MNLPMLVKQMLTGTRWCMSIILVLPYYDAVTNDLSPVLTTAIVNALYIRRGSVDFRHKAY